MLRSGLHDRKLTQHALRIVDQQNDVERLIGRDWFELTEWNLTPEGACASCGTPCAGRFQAALESISITFDPWNPSSPNETKAPLEISDTTSPTRIRAPALR